MSSGAVRSGERCPRCRVSLAAQARDGITACPNCGGLWLEQRLAEELDAALAQRVALRFGEEAARIGDQAARRAVIPDVDTAGGDLPCPACGVPMGRTRIARAYLEVDSCPSHGTWFDRGEMQRVVRSLSGGQAENARPALPGPSKPFLPVASGPDERILENLADRVEASGRRELSLIEIILAFFS